MKTRIRRALARAYTHPENSRKELDSELIEAMVEELSFLWSLSGSPLTKRQSEIYDYVKKLDCIILQDVADHFGIAINSLRGSFILLARKGYMTNDPNSVPAWFVTDKTKGTK